MKPMIKFGVGIILFTIFVGFSTAWASPFSQFGYGSENQAMGNANFALPTGAFSQAYNPALMSYQNKALFSLGLEGAITNFNSVNGVIIDRPDLGASAVTYGNINTNSPDTFLSTLAYEGTLNSGEKPFHFGINGVIPVQYLYKINSTDAFVPQYSMYNGDTQRMLWGLALSKLISDEWSLGAGGQMYLVQGLSNRQRLPAGGNATSNLSGDIKPGFAPVAGIIYSPAGSNWKAGLSYRGLMDYRTKINVDSQIGLLASPSDLIFAIDTSIDYDPDTFMAGWSYVSGNNSFAAGIKCELWAGYNGGVNHMTFQTYTGSFSQRLPDVNFRNVCSLHGGIEHKMTRNKLRGGYAWVPTPVPDQSGELNILDSDKHEIYAGWGTAWDKWFMDGVLKLDLVVFADVLTSKSVSKTTQAQANNALGSPGYNIGGAIFGYGATLSREY